MGDTLGGVHGKKIDLIEHNGLGSGEREVVFVDYDGVFVYFNLGVLVERVHWLKYAYKLI